MIALEAIYLSTAAAITAGSAFFFAAGFFFGWLCRTERKPFP